MRLLGSPSDESMYRSTRPSGCTTVRSVTVCFTPLIMVVLVDVEIDCPPPNPEDELDEVKL